MSANISSIKSVNIEVKPNMLQIIPDNYMYLFWWWAVCISFCILFITLIAVYVYAANRVKRKEDAPASHRVSKIARNFMFVWILLGLLMFYYVSVLFVSVLL